MRWIGLSAVIAVLAVIGVGGVLLLGRGDGQGTPGNGPVGRTERFERALIKSDCVEVKKLVVASDQLDCASLGEISESVKDVDPNGITYKVVESGKDSATVRITVNGEKQNLDLVKQDGTWLVIFDTAA